MHFPSLRLVLPFVFTLFASSLARADAPPPVPTTGAPPSAVPPPEAPPPLAAAAEPEGRRHDGVYFRVSLGAGATDLQTPRNSSESRFGGAAFALQIGGTPIEGVVVGGGWRLASAASVEIYPGTEIGVLSSVLGPFVDWYPDPRGGWHIGAMPGFGVTTFTGARAVGFGASVFGGYDARVSQKLSLGVDASVTGVRRAHVTTDSSEQPIIDGSVAPLSFSVAFTLLYH